MKEFKIGDVVNVYKSGKIVAITPSYANPQILIYQVQISTSEFAYVGEDSIEKVSAQYESHMREYSDEA